MPHAENRSITTTGLEHNSIGRPIFSSTEKGYEDYREPFDIPTNLNNELLERIKSADNPTPLLKGSVYKYVKDMGLDISIEAVRERMERAHIIDSSTKEYIAAERKIRAPIRKPISNRNLASNFHEIFHSASGQIFTPYNEGDELVMHPIVVGIRRRRPKEAAHSAPVTGWFTWLNEAVTIELTDDLLRQLGLPMSGKAGADVEMLNKLIDLGVPFGSFVEAYFEEPKLTESPGHRMPKWHNLQVLLKSVFGPRFLQKLDERILDRK